MNSNYDSYSIEEKRKWWARKAQRKLEPSTELDGDWGVQFINNLTLCGGYSGQQMLLRPFQEEAVRAIFERKNEEENQFKKLFLFWPRGSAKTQLIASVIVARLLGDPRHGQSIYSAAKTQKQSGLIFERIAQIIRQDPFLDDLCEISDFKKRIDVKSKFSFYQALTHDTSGGATLGLDPSLIIIDELVAFGRKRDYFSALETSLGKRKDQQLIIITTAGEMGSIVEEEFLFAKKHAADPSIDPTFFSSLYYLEKDAPCLCGEHDQGYLCPQQWFRCNPALGDFKEIGAMESMAIQAVDNPGKAYEFKKFHLNMFMHDTEALIPMDHFRQCQKFPVEEDDLLGQVCWGGLDIGAVSDWTALLLIFKTDDGIKVLSYYWIPEGTLVEQQRKTKMPIVEWASRDLIRTTEGNVTDFDVVRKDINEICDKFKVEKIGLDPHNATQLATQLDQDGLPLEWFRQGFITMNSPVNEMVRLIISHQLHFGNDPVMGWMMENAQAIHDSCGNVRIDRQNRNCKVDAVVSLAEAIGVAGLCEKKESVYKSRGLIVL